VTGDRDCRAAHEGKKLGTRRPALIMRERSLVPPIAALLPIPTHQVR